VARITHRIPWRAPYGYSEVVYETGEAVDFAALALDAVTMEDSHAAYLQKDEPPAPERHGEPEYDDRDAPPRDDRREAPRGSQRPQQGRGGDSNQYGITLKCPDHGAILRPSVRNKNMDYIEDLGKEIPASWFHTGPDGRTCSVYQSRAEWVR